jgi:CBS domain-containing protein
MQVHHILSGKSINALWSVQPETTVLEALELMSVKNIGAVLVLKDGQLTGIFSERDYARKVVLQGRASRDTQIANVMTTAVITVTPTQKIEECMQLMSDLHIRHLPVVEADKLIGIISINDIVTAIIRDQKARIQSLESYISGAPYQ